MKEFKSIFLGDKGLSQSEANHTANVTKELAERIKAKLNKITIVEETLDINGKIYLYNTVESVPSNITSLLQEEGHLYALSAWLREGIKSKEALLAQAQHASSEDFDLVMPVFPIRREYPARIQRPVLNEMPQEEEGIEFLSIKERADYIIHEARAAHIGKKIHDQGLLVTWAKQIDKFNPVDFLTQNDVTGIITKRLLMSSKEVEDLFFAMQREHREAEKQVNYYKAMIHNTYNDLVIATSNANAVITARLADEQRIYNETVRSIDEESKNEIETYNSEVAVISEKLKSLRAALVKQISGWKIKIPFELEPTLKIVQEFSKRE